jgi:hypothetical protein
MNPTLTSLGSNHGADTFDDHLDDPIEYLEQERENHANHPDTSGTGRKVPHITPKIAPPKIVRRYDSAELPEIGVWVLVTVADGKRKETLQGRVEIADTRRLRLRQGAGWWEIPLTSVLSIITGDDPAHRGR